MPGSTARSTPSYRNPPARQSRSLYSFFPASFYFLFPAASLPFHLHSTIRPPCHPGPLTSPSSQPHDIYNLEYNCSCCIHRISNPGQQTPINSLSGSIDPSTNSPITACKETTNSCPSSPPTATNFTPYVPIPTPPS